MEFDAIVAGAGIWGCTVARRLAEAGKRVLVLEKRKAVGGNCRCEIDPETGIEVHTYGSHIFHTSNEEVWNFVRRFTEFNDYRHCVLAKTRATGRDGVGELESWRVGKLERGRVGKLTTNCTNGGGAGREKSEGESRWIEEKITSDWFDVIDPSAVEEMNCIAVPADDDPLTDRRAIKDVFQGFGEVENIADGRRVIFPAKSAGKMLGQSGIDIRRYVRSFADMFRQSIRAWSEKEAIIESHKQHRNITAYHQYVVKANLGASTCYVRFTVREDAGGKVKRNEVHSSTISRVTVYKAKGAELSDLGHAQVEDSTPFVDNKVSYFLNGVKGGAGAKGEFGELESWRVEKLERGERNNGFSGLNGLRRDGEGNYLYHLPIGKTLLKEFFGRDLAPSELTAADRGAIFDAFIRGYSSKQWGVPPEKVDPSVIARLKVRDNYSTDYFDDPHQGIPVDGYNRMFERMLDHPNITVQCGCELRMDENEDSSRSARDLTSTPLPDRCAREARALRDGDASSYRLAVCGDGAEWINQAIKQSPNQTIYYSGPIDALFNFKYGALPWRTLRFERETLPVADYQGNAVVNYTDADVPFTRIHEFAHYHPESRSARALTSTPLPDRCARESRALREGDATVDSPKTIISREYSATWKPGDEPYYPIATPESAALLARYQAEVDHFNQTIKQSNNQTILRVGGRLGQYKYFDMDKSVAAALAVEI